MDSWCTIFAAFLLLLTADSARASSSSICCQLRFWLGRSTNPGRVVAFEVRVWTGICEEFGERVMGRGNKRKDKVRMSLHRYHSLIISFSLSVIHRLRNDRHRELRHVPPHQSRSIHKFRSLSVRHARQSRDLMITCEVQSANILLVARRRW